MSIFGFGNPAELQTPIGIQIKAATDSLRLTPDWSKNLEICDEINRKKDVADQACRALKKRLQDADQQTVYLSLLLLEACMKNCGTNFLSTFDRALMDEIVTISRGGKGNKNSEEALRLIQQWAHTYENNKSLSLFQETFISLKSRGVVFPNVEKEPHPSDLKTPARDSTSISKPSADPAPSKNAVETKPSELEKLRSDLAVVEEKVKLCREMLLVSPGIESDEALADVIGFLEACRDRLVDLVEAGAQGLLGEEIFELVLKLNESVHQTLEAEKNGTKIDVEGSGKEKGGESKTGNLLDLDSSPLPQQNKPPVVDDPFDALFGAPSKSENQIKQAAPVPVIQSSPQVSQNKEERNDAPPSGSKPAPSDDFDAFFASLK